MPRSEGAINYGPGTYEWLSAAAGTTGRRVTDAVHAFVAAIAGNPVQQDYPLQVLRDHDSSAAAGAFGIVLSLGHPQDPAVFGVRTQPSGTGAVFTLDGRWFICPAADYLDDASNGGYGTAPNLLTYRMRTWSFRYGSYSGDNGNGSLSVAFDTTPGTEFLLLRHHLVNSSVIVLFFDQVTQRWVVMLRDSGGTLACGMVRNGESLVGDYIPQRWGQRGRYINHPVLLCFPPAADGVFDRFQLSPVIVCQGPLWIGRLFNLSTCLITSDQGVTFYVLNDQGTDHPMLFYEADPEPQQLDGFGTWAATFTWTPWTFTAELLRAEPMVEHFIGGANPIDEVSEWAPISRGLFGALNHPLVSQSPLLPGGGDGDGGGSSRPAAGVLWPRRA